MGDIREELLGVVRAMNGAGVPYALCGGLAVVLHGYPRATRDIDLLIREEDLDRAREILGGAGFKLESGIIPFKAGKPEKQRLFRISKVEGAGLLTIDLLLVTPSLENVWNTRESYVLEGEEVSAVSRDGHIQMKTSAGREIDLADIRRLREIADGDSES